ncbi:MAG: hypothetical protein EPN37_15500 [Chitinophagaceae bacterium]|nr:MAG: hypothetical protein EPN37_15500 [Chitinophagaceae bacterium]
MPLSGNITLTIPHTNTLVEVQFPEFHEPSEASGLPYFFTGLSNGDVLNLPGDAKSYDKS